MQDLTPLGVRVGVDESGKGDYFGPLVSAAVRVEPGAAAELEALGVADSKTLADPRIAALADAIRERSASEVAVLAPPAYNDVYERHRRHGETLNDLLAELHVQTIRAVPAAPLVIVDQFGAEHHLERRLRDRAFELRQHPRAEADVAVAAASVLAREAFLAWVAVHGLPKGAGPLVVAAARAIAAQEGREGLRRVAKLHFATTETALSG